MPEQLPLGIKVAGFSWVGVGAITSKYLADHGATVVRVETESRPDILHIGATFKDGMPGPNRSQFYAEFNTSKYGVVLDLKSEAGLAVARQLVAWSDVYLESFSAGIINNLGLGYQVAKSLNPSIIMTSACLMGQSGPAVPFAGYGFHAGSIGGFYEPVGQTCSRRSMGGPHRHGSAPVPGRVGHGGPRPPAPHWPGPAYRRCPDGNDPAFPFTPDYGLQAYRKVISPYGQPVDVHGVPWCLSL